MQNRLIWVLVAAVLFLFSDAGVRAETRSSEPDLAPGTELTSIAFGSCLNEEDAQPIWDAVIALKPQLFLAMGDNVYADIKAGQKVELGPQLGELREAYDRLAAHPDFSRASAAFPIWAVWDDHDYGKNDAGGDFAFKQKAAELFRDFWNETGARGLAAAPGLYASQIFGPEGRRAQIILLDTRFFRSPLINIGGDRAKGIGPYGAGNDPDATILGEEQWKWLEGELKKPADLRIVVSSIQVLSTAHQWERWGAFPLERTRLLSLLGANEVPAVILSGDRHAGAIYKLDQENGRTLVEITSSSMNLPLRRKPADGPDLRVGEVHPGENFGTLGIDWNAGMVTVSLRGMDGSEIRTLSVPLD